MSELRINGNPRARPIDAQYVALWQRRAILWHNITRCRQKVAYKQPARQTATRGPLRRSRRRANPTQPAGISQSARLAPTWQTQKGRCLLQMKAGTSAQIAQLPIGR